MVLVVISTVPVTMQMDAVMKSEDVTVFLDGRVCM